MLRKLMIAGVAVAAIAAASVPTDVSARPWHGGWHGGGGWLGGGWHGGGWRRGWGWGPRFGVYPAFGAYAYGYGCWRPVRVFTPWGPRWRRTWVCG
jgi:hypothetical protein